SNHRCKHRLFGYVSDRFELFLPHIATQAQENESLCFLVARFRREPLNFLIGIEGTSLPTTKERIRCQDIEKTGKNLLRFFPAFA
ncbi:MAG: hypothetical protein SPJ23_03260, partial [Eubacteriales bacterium]|nr:hypothetical protein [Eubacteriales bacterium]